MTRTEEQRLLKESVDRFVAERYGFAERRRLASSELGFSEDHWKLMAELGWLALPFEEAYGGLGAGSAEVAILMEAFGRALAVEPYASTVVLAGGLLAATGSEAQKRALLPRIGEGELRLAFAHAEPESGFDLAHVAARATEAHGAFRLSGRKAVVVQAAAAHQLLVSARVEGEALDPRGIALFLVDRDASGLRVESYPTVDGLRAGEVVLSETPAERMGDGEALEAIETAVHRTIVALGAEAVGSMGALVHDTTAYLKTRHQFGVPLASFQALQHRLVDLYVDYELSRALVFRAAASIDSEEPEEAAHTASAVKAQIGKAGRRIGKEAIQLHGGMGMTDDLPVGHYFKRLTMIDVSFGNADAHLKRLLG